MIEDRHTEAKSNNSKTWWKSISALGMYCLQYSTTKDIQDKSSAHSWGKQRYWSIARIKIIFLHYMHKGVFTVEIYL